VKPKQLSALAEVAATMVPSTLLSQTRAISPLSQLSLGPNKGSLVMGKITAIISGADVVPTTFILVDAASNLRAVSVYNIAAGILKAGDSVVIPDPVIKSISFIWNNKETCYKCLQTDYAKIEINGELFNEKNFAQSALTLKCS